MPERPLTIEILVSPGCPHAEDALDLVRRVAAQLAPHADVRRIDVSTPEQAAVIGFLGSPSVRVNGCDLEGRTGEGVLACRVYDGAGAPPEWLVEAAIARALEPKCILFLCVANSARSQMAEGIARTLAPAGTKLWYAGSQPAALRPEAIEVMREIGIDIAGQKSKGISEIPAGDIDLVITLCADEICPPLLGKGVRLHWAFPDPAGVQGLEERAAAYRRVRDGLYHRITLLLGA